jgi:soluble lytic murein transglycosylase
MLVYVLALLPLTERGYLPSVDRALNKGFDRVLGGSADVSGPTPRELALRRLVDKTDDLLVSEGAYVSRRRLMEIAKIADRAGLKFQLPPSLILSVIHSESHFRQDAVSNMGACGLMQVQLATARHFAPKAGLSEPSTSELFDPETNIILGTGYLRHLIDRFGDLRTALAAYHVGPSEIGRRLVENEPFSDRYGVEIRTRETFFTAKPVQPRPVPQRCSGRRDPAASAPAALAPATGEPTTAVTAAVRG